MRSGRRAQALGAAVFGLADELLVSPGIIELDQHTPSTPIERRVCLLDGACCQEPRSGDCLAEVPTTFTA